MANALLFPSARLVQLIETLVTHLKTSGQTVSFVETATGGILGSSLLAVPGTSKVFRGGLTLYTLESRIAYGGWTQADVDKYSGPTTDIVKGLATHVRKDLKADWVLAESGTAGPTGGKTRNRTPGYVALAVVGADGSWTREVETGLGTDRVSNMLRFAEEGVKLLLEAVQGSLPLDITEEGKL